MLTKRKYKSTSQEETTDKVLYEQVYPPSPYASIGKNDPKCQRTYDVVVDTNPTKSSDPIYDNTKL